MFGCNTGHRVHGREPWRESMIKFVFIRPGLKLCECAVELLEVVDLWFK